MKVILTNTQASNSYKQTLCAKCGSVGDFISKCGGKHAYHTAWGDLQKANAKQPSKQRRRIIRQTYRNGRGEGYSLSLSLSF